MWRDAIVADGLAARRVEFSGRNPQPTIYRVERKDALDGTLTETPPPNNRSTPMVSNRTRENLARASRVSVDEHDQRQPPRTGRMGSEVEILSIAASSR